MKSLVLILACCQWYPAWAQVTKPAWNGIRAAATKSSAHRRLEEDTGDYAFLVSNIRPSQDDWCITAPTNNSSDGNAIGFQICDFENQSEEQLWMYSGDNGSIRSYSDMDKCITVRTESGRRARLMDCDAANGVNAFQYNNNGTASRIELLSEDADDTTLCLTNQGASPNDTDPILAQECLDSGRFYFSYVKPDSGEEVIEESETEDPMEEAPTMAPTTMKPDTDAPTMAPTTMEPDTDAPTMAPTTMEPDTVSDDYLDTPDVDPYTYVAIVNENANKGCMVVVNEDPIPGQQLFLGRCDRKNHDWHYDENTGLIRTSLDGGKSCLQVEYPDTPDVVSGVPLRVFPCDADNDRQVFDFDYIGEDQIQLRSREGGDLCVGHRGNNPNVGSDFLIMKPCDLPGVLWTTKE